MDPVTLGCIAGGVIGGISAVGLLAQRRWMASSMRNRRHVAKVPHVALADLQERQLARVVGRAVKLEDLLEAPLSTAFPRHGLDDRNLRYREAIIEVGETIAVVGSGVREPDRDAMPEGAYRDAQRTCLRMTSSRKQPMIISDGKKATE
jgi:hypothetical protein